MVETNELIFAVSVCYVSVQAVLLLLLSVYGYCFVNETINTAASLQDVLNRRKIQSVSVVVAIDQLQDTSNKTTSKNPKNNKTKQIFISWIKVVWKLRSVYSSFVIHTFDIITDVIVIITWWSEESGENNETYNVDTKLMAQTSIGIIIFHKIMSSFAVWISERSIIRVILQFFDLLIFFEIFKAHKKVISQYSNARGHGPKHNSHNKYGMCLFALFICVNFLFF